MFFINWFKKKEKKQEEENLDNFFPPAEDMFERTKRAWKEKSPKEILDKMEKEADDGKRYADFFNATLSAKTERALNQKHYTVKTNEIYGTPHFKVSW